MLASDDTELLREYALRNSETAFATLVSRHLDMVYATALRHAGNHHQAQEIAQAVFVILARKARSLGPKTVLAGWLFQTARLTAANHMRAEIRRARREQEAYIQSHSSDDSSDAWQQMIPLLNELVGSLREKERDAIVLRFLQGKEYQEVAAAMGGSEAAAQMRVSRALEKLRGMFAKRGVTVTAVVMVGMMSACGTQAAPFGLAARVAATAVQGASLTASTLSLVKGTMNIMAWTKARLAVGAGVVALLAVQYHENSVQARNLAAAQEILSAGQSEFAAQEARITDLDQDTASILKTRISQQEELKKLRSRRTAERSTPATSPAVTLLSAKLQDPAAREVLRKGLADAARFRLAPLLESLKLEPADSDKLIQLDADWGLNNLETVAAVAEGRMTAEAAAQSEAQSGRDGTNQIQLLLGEAGLAKFEECQQTFPARALVQQFDKQLGVFPLNAFQQSALSQLILAEPLNLTSGLTGDLTVRSLVFPEELSQQFNQEADMNARLLQEAGAFLTPEQVESLKLMQTVNLSLQKRNALQMLRRL
ncbi:MAG TPA: sigma-70 family RNA polymerase sigma factor [Verrucomicrobiae bacterium]|jgi:RNA polymerase sigma factor (sigma-70 family)|nr:sigma-70 family RNA polymerase sigma factor [Verrucomicrobiae bacterium]